MHEAQEQEQGTGIQDDEISELFADFPIEARKPVAEEAVNAMKKAWVTIEHDD